MGSGEVRQQRRVAFIRSHPPLEGDVGCSGIYVNKKEASQGLKRSEYPEMCIQNVVAGT